MNEEDFIKKTTEFIDQVYRRVEILEREINTLKDWLHTLQFFVDLRVENKMVNDE